MARLLELVLTALMVQVVQTVLMLPAAARRLRVAAQGVLFLRVRSLRCCWGTGWFRLSGPGIWSAAVSVREMIRLLRLVPPMVLLNPVVLMAPMAALNLLAALHPLAAAGPAHQGLGGGMPGVRRRCGRIRARRCGCGGCMWFRGRGSWRRWTLGRGWCRGVWPGLLRLGTGCAGCPGVGLRSGIMTMLFRFGRVVGRRRRIFRGCARPVIRPRKHGAGVPGHPRRRKAGIR
ncbi:hypothetical protein ABIB35_000917 [Arthrobacter sp. UYP6]